MSLSPLAMKDWRLLREGPVLLPLPKRRANLASPLNLRSHKHTHTHTHKGSPEQGAEARNRRVVKWQGKIKLCASPWLAGTVHPAPGFLAYVAPCDSPLPARV